MRMPLMRNLYYAIGQRLPFLGVRPPAVDRQAAMTLRPGRNPLLTWEKLDGGETILRVPLNDRKKRVARLLAWWFSAPPERKVELDEVGSFVWDLCDGGHTVEAIVRATGQEYKLNRREAEVSVTAFLQILHERHFVSFYKKKRTRRTGASGS